MSHENTNQNFRPDYERLELPDTADWQDTRRHYRRLVHTWHPDRYTDRPREKSHAQKQFIELTKSYKRLRSFYQEHDRLPYQPVTRKAPGPSTEQTLDSSHRRARRVNAGASSLFKSRSPKSDESDLLRRDRQPTTHEDHRAGASSKPLWLMSLAALLVVTAGTFLYLDRSANQATIEKAREVLKQSEPSEFMVDTDKIRRIQAREKVLTPPK